MLRQSKVGKDIKQLLYVPTVYLDFTGIRFMQAVGKFYPDSEGIEKDYLHVYFYFSPDEKHPEPELFPENLKDFKKNGYLYIVMHFDWSCNILYGYKLLQWCGGQEDGRPGLVKDLMPKYCSD
jgi:hypothetical protein